MTFDFLTIQKGNIVAELIEIVWYHMDKVQHTFLNKWLIFAINVSNIGQVCCSSSCVSHLISMCVCLFLSVPLIHLPTHFLHMQMQMSTAYLTSSEFHGSHPRWCCLVMLFHTSVLCGILQPVQLKYPQRRNKNTLRWLKNGRRNHATPWLKYKSYTENYYTPPWLTQPDKHTSQAWRPCSVYSTIGLSCHTPHPAICFSTSGGGLTSSVPQPFPDPFQAPQPSKTFMPSQMQALVLASASSLVNNGMLGVYSQAGSQREETSVGQRWSILSLSYSLSCHPAAAILTLGLLSLLDREQPSQIHGWLS